MKNVIWLILLLLLVLQGCGQLKDANQNTTNQVPVLRVVDGDTIEVKFNNEEVAVRILNIDTPEVHGKNAPQKWGKEASLFAKNMLEGNVITLEISQKENPYDKYGRLLANIHIDNELYQQRIVSEGLARVAYVYDPDLKYVETLRKAENEAKANQQNIWSISGYVTSEGFNMAVVPETSLKHKMESKYSGPFDPFGSDRDCNDFRTKHEAQLFFIAAGGPDKDRHRLDGSDKDGFVCESLP